MPDLTPEDLRNPQDFAALVRDPEFNYEDGLLAGLRSAHMAIRAELRGDGMKFRFSDQGDDSGDAPGEVVSTSHDAWRHRGA